MILAPTEIVKMPASVAPQASSAAATLDETSSKLCKEQTLTTTSITTSAIMSSITSVTSTTSMTSCAIMTTGCEVTASAMATTTITTSTWHYNELNQDGKRKQPNENEEVVKAEVRIVNNSSEELIKILLTEMREIKAEVKSGNERMEKIQQENNDWKSTASTLQKDMVDIKESVEMAHNLINDETAERKKDIGEIKEQMLEKSKEVTSSLHQITSQ